jgi:hypothetical protein
MNQIIPISKSRSIRDCGFDEYWLQEQISANPNCLGLGELEVITRERLQSSGGRLDLLLKDPEDDTMFEVEIMLGETDESHIIRTIEYWDNEKRKWPQRQHFAVLVAETITSRFFNVIQLFSHAIPIIAIQANLIVIEEQKFLHFTKILDTYEEPEDSVSLTNEIHDEEFWKTKSPWTIDTSKCLLEIVSDAFVNCSLNYVKNYIAISVNGNNFVWLHKRSANKSLLSFWVNDNLIEQAENLLDEKAISHVKKNQTIRITVDKTMIEANKELFKEIAKLIKQSWES